MKDFIKERKCTIAYWSDGRGRYGTGESYEWFSKYENGVDIFESDDGLWTCTHLDNGVEILRYNGNETNIVIPSEIKGRKVISLESTFDGFVELKRVVIPEGVTSIEGAFYGCESLEQIALSESIVTLWYSFNCCFELKHIDIPSKVKNIAEAFGNTGLRNITLPDGIEDMSRSFIACENLEYVYIPGTVKNLEECFADCENLREAVIEHGITSIGEYAFFNCSSLKELTIPESVTTFGKYAVGIMERREYTSPNKYGYKVKGYPGSSRLQNKREIWFESREICKRTRY